MRPALQVGARAAGREHAPPILLQLVVTADRDSAARQMIAYTVPGYRRVLDHAGLGNVADRVMAASKAGERSQARALIEEHYLDLLGVSTDGDLAAAVRRWGPHCDRLSLSVPWFGLKDEEQLAAAHQLVDAIEALPDA
jgi:hypothetical protein